ncbi:MAG: hypothetical protein EWM73_03629 [Nitrospira sp.]|nr:MAG: hypothetical protein EWM73_03629 [Nitrospira sp.]
MSARHSASLSSTRSTRPVISACIFAPASVSKSTVSPMPPLTSVGPDQPSNPVPRTITAKSESNTSIGGRPKQGPSTAAT